MSTPLQQLDRALQDTIGAQVLGMHDTVRALGVAVAARGQGGATEECRDDRSNAPDEQSPLHRAQHFNHLSSRTALRYRPDVSNRP